MNAVVNIRLYESRDRAAVRRICCETADNGGPVEGFFRDRELVADLVTRYYTDFEPESCWVAEVAGAMSACSDGVSTGIRRMDTGSDAGCGCPSIS